MKKLKQQILQEFKDKISKMWRKRSDGNGRLKEFDWTKFDEELEFFLSVSIDRIIMECKGIKSKKKKSPLEGLYAKNRHKKRSFNIKR